MVISCVTKMITTFSPMAGHLFHVMIVTKTGYTGNETAKLKSWEGLETVSSCLNLDIPYHS